MNAYDTWSSVDLRSATEAARRALAEYGFDDDAEVCPIGVSENAVFRIESNDRIAGILRIHRRGYHTAASIRSEFLWMQALRTDCGLLVPQVVPTTHGALVVPVTESTGGGLWLASLLDYLPGVHPRADQIGEVMESIGAITATLHLHASRWVPDPWFERPFWDCENILGSNARFGSWKLHEMVTATQMTILENLEAALWNDLDTYGKDSDRFGLIHADIRLENMLLNGQDVCVIDFDDCGFGWYMYDVSAILAFFDKNYSHGELVAKWISGYEQVRRLSGTDERLIAAFILLRRLLLIGWSATHASAHLAGTLDASFIDDTCLMAGDYSHNRSKAIR